MAEEKMMRLSVAAKKLNVGIQTLVEKLGVQGQRVDNNPNSKLNFDQLQILAKEYKSPSLLEDSPVAPKPVEEPAPSRRDDSDIAYFRSEPTPVAPKPVVEAPKPVEEKPVVVEIPKPVVVETKVEVAKPKPAPVAVIEKPVVAPVAVISEKAPEPIVKVEISQPVISNPIISETPKVAEIEVIRAKAEPEGLRILGKIDLTPKKPAEKSKQPERPKYQDNRPSNSDRNGGQNRNNQQGGRTDKPVERKPETFIKPTPPPVKATPPPVIEIEAVEEEIDVVRAKGEQLKGLTVLGKIQLPSDKKPVASSDDRNKKRKRKRIVKEPAKPAASSTPGVGTSRTPNTNTRPAANTNAGATNATSNNSNNNAKGGNKKGGGKKDSFSDSDVKDNIKKTMATLQSKGNDFGSKYRKDKRKNRADQEERRLQDEEVENSILKVTEFISASELASLMDVSVNEVIGTCMGMGMFVSINQRLDAEQIQMICLEFDFDVQFISAEEEIKSDVVTVIDNPEDLTDRAPIVTIMGHVDHGKTSLLDYIRRTKVASGEAGGITQHIGAYSVTMGEGPNKGKKITFLDTPGHEAFTAMRARGAKVTDVVIIVVAADDSVMPQTREAINHAQNAGVPIVIALNKIDKDGANTAKIREDLAKENILVESWGGKYQEQEISAKKGLGIDELLDKVILESDILELKANKNRLAVGTVIEASLDKGRGYVTTILIETGTMRVGDVILAGQYFGKVRAMINDLGERIKEAGPSMPVQILGIPGAPQAGDKFNIMETEREAREIATKREQILREQSMRAKKHITLDEIGRRKAIGNFQQLNLIVKGDFDGSVEALADSLQKLSTEEVQVAIIHKAVGQISESDVLLASAGDAIIVGFQVRPSANAKKIADNEQIEIRTYSVIYNAIEEIKEAMTGMLAPKIEEHNLGNIEVREVFKITKVGTIAGCYVLDGVVKRNQKIRVIRDGIVVHEGEISALKRFKDDVAEVRASYECGLSIKGFSDIQELDIIECYELKEVKRTL